MSVLRNTPFGTENIFREACLLSTCLVAYDPHWAWLYYYFIQYFVFLVFFTASYGQTIICYFFFQMWRRIKEKQKTNSIRPKGIPTWVRKELQEIWGSFVTTVFYKSYKTSNFQSSVSFFSAVCLRFWFSWIISLFFRSQEKVTSPMV